MARADDRRGKSSIFDAKRAGKDVPLAKAPDHRAGGKAVNPEPGKRSSVVVSRPAKIIGAAPQMVGKKGKPFGKKSRGSIFGKDLISEKSLDEVIMAYLSEDGSEE